MHYSIDPPFYVHFAVIGGESVNLITLFLQGCILQPIKSTWFWNPSLLLVVV